MKINSAMPLYKYINPGTVIILVIIIILTAEIICRTRFFLKHGKDWNYITTPFLVHPWNMSCKDKKVYSPQYKKLMDITYDSNCFRGDSVHPGKNPSEFRIFVLGDSSVDSPQSDQEVWTNRMKSYLPAATGQQKLKIVNAGHPGFGSPAIKSLYEDKIRLFSPDLILYYAAANESIEFTSYAAVDRSIEQIKNRTHKLLHYRSMLYTYLCEKVSFLKGENKKAFWVIDLAGLKDNLLGLNVECVKSGSKFIFITQAMNLQRFFKGVDTFKYEKVLNLLNSLKDDTEYKYDNEEIRMLNQRLAVFYSIELCEKHNIPYINILNEIESLGDAGRNEMFLDFIHQTHVGDSVLGELIGRSLNKFLVQLKSKGEMNETNR